MRLRDVIAAGVKPFAQNRLRAGLSILGICIGIAGVLCMVAIGDGAKKIITEFVSGIGIMNICLVSVGEKTREIGLRKSVGAKRIHIFYQLRNAEILILDEPTAALDAESEYALFNVSKRLRTA